MLRYKQDLVLLWNVLNEKLRIITALHVYRRVGKPCKLEKAPTHLPEAGRVRDSLDRIEDVKEHGRVIWGKSIFCQLLVKSRPHGTPSDGWRGRGAEIRRPESKFFFI